jgi:hypothetical protein
MRVCKADAGLKSLDLGGGKLFGAGNNACMYVWDLQSSSETPLSADRLARAGAGRAPFQKLQHLKRSVNLLIDWPLPLGVWAHVRLVMCVLCG